jgi:transcription elongation factor GreA
MHFITRFGLAKLKQDYERILVEEKLALGAMSDARLLGDFSENYELMAAKERVRNIRAEKIKIENVMTIVKEFDVSLIEKKQVHFGACVTMRDMETNKEFRYTFVNAIEADATNGKISVQSPLARALLGKICGDECKYNTPNGEKRIVIENIDYSWLE